MKNAALATRVADTIAEAFAAYEHDFRAITRHARTRFEQCEWPEGQRDAEERLLLYPRRVRQNVTEVQALLDGSQDMSLGAAAKERYARQTEDRPDGELAETFFNSVSRRVFGVIGVDARVEYTSFGSDPAHPPSEPAAHAVYPAENLSGALFRAILADLPLDGRYRDATADAELCARTVRDCLRREGKLASARTIEVLPAVFFRNKGAYLVGRIRHADRVFTPLLLALLNGPDGIYVDAVLMTPDDASVVFSFTRSYFHVEVGRPRAAIGFLRSIMPHKRVDELYTSIGHNKHGKRVLYRDLMRHLESGNARFTVAEGVKGMVMSVFTLPSFNIVFKIIKDEFAFPKETTRRGVMEKYRLVFVRDRVGRLADAQEFEHLELSRRCFDEGLLDELLGDAGNTVECDGDEVLIRHLYTERRVRPLDLFLQGVDPNAARAAVIDYGYAIKDLAAANIFPGDMLLKNFGVTRHGRVIFYDYDELALLTDRCFRVMPQPRSPEDEMRTGAWFSVDERDVFPQELLPFMIPEGTLRDAFLDVHADLFAVEFWREIQHLVKAGEVADVYPYDRTRRLRPTEG